LGVGEKNWVAFVEGEQPKGKHLAWDPGMTSSYSSVMKQKVLAKQPWISVLTDFYII
jgi:hypothetical protein